MPTGLEVIDSAIKIGLGALIAGLASFFSERSRHSNEQKKLVWNRRADIIERVAASVQKHSQATLELRKVFSRLKIGRRFIIAEGRLKFKDQEDSDNLNKAWTSIDETMAATSVAHSGLKLLGESAACQKLQAYMESCRDIAAPFLTDATNWEEMSASDWANISQRLSAFYEELSKAFGHASKTKGS
jgi:hypothetical protein